MNTKSKSDVLPYDIIVQAVGGGYEAIKMVLIHNVRYIDSLSKRIMYDDYGKAHIYIDEQLKLRLQNKLVQKISHFNL